MLRRTSVIRSLLLFSFCIWSVALFADDSLHAFVDFLWRTAHPSITTAVVRYVRDREDVSLYLKSDSTKFTPAFVRFAVREFYDYQPVITNLEKLDAHLKQAMSEMHQSYGGIWSRYNRNRDQFSDAMSIYLMLDFLRFYPTDSESIEHLNKIVITRFAESFLRGDGKYLRFAAMPNKYLVPMYLEYRGNERYIPISDNRVNLIQLKQTENGKYFQVLKVEDQRHPATADYVRTLVNEPNLLQRLVDVCHRFLRRS